MAGPAIRSGFCPKMCQHDREEVEMLTITWRNLVRGTASVLLAAGISVPVLADEASDDGAPSTAQTENAEAVDLSGPVLGDVLSADFEGSAEAAPGVQVAQGITTYEQRRRQVDDPRRGDTVQGRARPQYDPLGQRIGAFVLLPELVLQEQYESNIFFTEDDEESDFITRIMPRLTLQSDWNNHSLQLESGGDFGFYADNTDENYQDYFVGASGRVDIKRSTQLRLRTRYSRDHESRESPDDADAGGVQIADEPTEIDIYSAGAALRHDFGRINATLGGTFDRLSFQDPDAIVGPPINEHDRDRNIYEGSLRVGYQIQPQYEAFVRGSYNQRDYDGLEGGVDRDSEGYAAAVGMEVDFGGVVFGDFFAGYRYQNYDDSTLDSLSGFGAGGEITWNVTKLTTIVGSLAGDLAETTQTGASGRRVATGEVEVDHELRRNILIGGNLIATRDDYEGINRTDWIYGAGADATYLINRYLRAGVGYDFRQRDGESSADDFTNHVFLVRLGLQY